MLPVARTCAQRADQYPNIVAREQEDITNTVQDIVEKKTDQSRSVPLGLLGVPTIVSEPLVKTIHEGLDSHGAVMIGHTTAEDKIADIMF